MRGTMPCIDNNDSKIFLSLINDIIKFLVSYYASMENNADVFYIHSLPSIDNDDYM